MNYGRFTPTGLPNMPFDMPLVAESFELSPMMRALSPWQEQMLLIDGLSNDQGLGSGHSTGYALSCVPNDPPNEVGSPGGETLDIFLSRTMGSTTLFPHVHLGVGRTFSPRIAAVSANAMRQPIPMFCRPADAYQQLFGAAFNAEGGRGGQRAELVMNLVRGDATRLKQRLGTEEQRKLDQVIEAVDTLDRRRRQLVMRADDIRACAPTLRTSRLS